MVNRLDQPDSSTAEAVLRTLLYADVFNFPMTEAEIHHFLIGRAATRGEVRTALDDSPWLARRVERVNGYCAVRGRTATGTQRHDRDRVSSALWPVARRYGRIMAHLPFVRMVALTGALAVRNASHRHDDIDFLLVTVPGRVWIARAFAVALVRLARLWGVSLCPNYVLAETALLQSRQDLFVAHELAQMVPLAGFPIYRAMRAANGWSQAMLPNAWEPFYAEPDARPRGLGRLVQRIGEILLSGPLGDRLEAWEQRRKLRKFQGEWHKPGSAAELDGQRIKGHFNDYGYPALERYQARLECFELAVNGLPHPLAPSPLAERGETNDRKSPSLRAERDLG